MKDRIISADLLRILAIYLIIFLHLGLPEYFNPKHHTNIIAISYIYIAVPLFVLLSGALLLGKSESYKFFFKKRFSKIIIPWILWTITFTLIIIFYNNLLISSFFGVFHSIFISMFWILPMISGLYLLTPSLRIFISNAKQRDVWLIILIWFVGISLLPHFRNTPGFPIATDNGVVRLVVNYFGFYIIGYMITQLKPSRNLIRIFVILFLIGLILSYITYAGIINSTVTNISPGTILISVSFFAIIYLSEKTIKNRINNTWREIIVKLSETTLGVFFVHFLFISNNALLPTIHISNKILLFASQNPFLNALLIYAISVTIILLLQKIPFVGKYVT